MVGHPHKSCLCYVQLRFSVSCFEEVKNQPFGYKVMDIQLFSYPFKLRLCPGFLCWLSSGFKDVLDFCRYPDP